LSNIPYLTWQAFAYSILVTREPQLVYVLRKGGAHELVAYAVSANGTLHVADPNYRGRTDREIKFANGFFEPYSSADNEEELKKGKGYKYDRIGYHGRSAILDWGQISKRWDEFDKRVIGNDVFPKYKFSWFDYRGKDIKKYDLVDGIVVDQEKLFPWVELKDQSGNDIDTGNPAWPDRGRSMSFWRGGKLLEAKYDKERNHYYIELVPGENRLGITVQYKEKYIDFKYVTVVLGTLTIDPATLEGEPDKPYTFTAVCTSPPAKARYEWAIDGEPVQSTESKVTGRFKAAGTYTITCKLYDDAVAGGKPIGEASATATIKGTASLSISALDGTSGVVGNSYRFKAAPQGIPGNATYQWYLNSSNMGSGNADSISTVTPREAKPYEVGLTASWITAQKTTETISATIMLNVTAAPSPTPPPPTPPPASTPSDTLQKCTISAPCALCGINFYRLNPDGSFSGEISSTNPDQCGTAYLKPGKYNMDICCPKPDRSCNWTKKQITVVAGGPNSF